jgi:hypothetical protein
VARDAAAEARLDDLVDEALPVIAAEIGTDALYPSVATWAAPDFAGLTRAWKRADMPRANTLEWASVRECHLSA